MIHNTLIRDKTINKDRIQMGLTFIYSYFYNLGIRQFEITCYECGPVCAGLVIIGIKHEKTMTIGAVDKNSIFRNAISSQFQAIPIKIDGQ